MFPSIAKGCVLLCLFTGCDGPRTPDRDAAASSTAADRDRVAGAADGRRSATGSAAPPATAPTATSPSTAAAAASSEPADAERLYGTWVAHDVDSKIGQVKIQLTFKRQGPVKLAAWSELPLVGQVRDKSAPYEVNGNVISSEAIRGGTSVEYHFDGDDLIIEYKEGKRVRFKRA